MGILSYRAGLTKLLDRTKHDANERTLSGGIRKPQIGVDLRRCIRIGGVSTTSVCQDSGGGGGADV